MFSESCRNMALVYSAEYVWTPLKTASFNGLVNLLRLLLNHGISVDNTDNEGQTLLRAAASNVHLEVLRELLSNGSSVHIPRKRDLIALQAAADS